jgi:hypothetical protein
MLTHFVSDYGSMTVSPARFSHGQLDCDSVDSVGIAPSQDMEIQSSIRSCAAFSEQMILSWVLAGLLDGLKTRFPNCLSCSEAEWSNNSLILRISIIEDPPCPAAAFPSDYDVRLNPE